MVKSFLSAVILFFTVTFVYVQPIQVKQTDVQKMEKTILAGGCFWCVESDLEKLPGVVGVVSGYSGGSGSNPTYKNYDQMGYIEVVEVTYNPAIITYAQLLDGFFRKIDPTDSGGQFCDRGPAYRPAIFYKDQAERKIAEQSKEKLESTKRFQKPINVELLMAAVFYPAEEYHQDYYKKNSLKYKFYRFNCGRDQFLEKAWGRTQHK